MSSIPGDAAGQLMRGIGENEYAGAIWMDFVDLAG